MPRFVLDAAAAVLLLAPALVAAAPTVELPRPWRAGLRLEYASESRIDATDAAGKRERTRFTDTTVLTVVRQAGRGVVQDWASRNPVFESLEGDPAKAAMQREVVDSLAGFALRVTVDADGNVRLDNLDALAERLRPVTRRTMAKQAEAGLAKLPEADRAAARTAMQARLDAALVQVTAPAVLDPIVGRQPRAYLAYVGAALEPNARIVRDIDLQLPDGGTIPAKVTTQLVLDPARRNHAIVRWRSTVDPARAGMAAWALVQRLTGVAPIAPTIGPGVQPEGLQVEDAGFVLIDRRDGVVELFENTRTVAYGVAGKVERQRMRLVGGDHAHAWTDAPTAALVDE